jgi:hypothetical protein
MADGHGRDRWARTSLLASILANANRDSKKHRAYRPQDFDPFAHEDRRRRTADRQSLSLLKEALEARKGF